MFLNIIENFHPTSKVWIFQPNRLLSENEIDLITQNAKVFNDKWNAHGANLSSVFNITPYEITFVVDANANQASGCSIDSLTRFIKQIQQNINVDFFDRMMVSYQENNKYNIAHYSKLTSNPKQIVLDNTVNNLNDYLNRAKPIAETWINNFI